MRRAWTELLLLVLTGATHFVFENLLDLKGPFMVVAGASWGLYVAWRLRSPGQARQWGLRLDTFRPSLLANLVFLIAGSAVMCAYGVSRGLPSAEFLIVLALYPLWGIVQQFLLCSLIGGNLFKITGSRFAAAVIGAVLFSLSHAPDWDLCGITSVAGAVWILLFLRWPNIWAQGIAHGLLGAIAFHYVLGRDTWLELQTELGKWLG